MTLVTVCHIIRCTRHTGQLSGWRLLDNSYSVSVLPVCQRLATRLTEQKPLIPPWLIECWTKPVRPLHPSPLYRDRTRPLRPALRPPASHTARPASLGTGRERDRERESPWDLACYWLLPMSHWTNSQLLYHKRSTCPSPPTHPVHMP